MKIWSSLTLYLAIAVVLLPPLCITLFRFNLVPHTIAVGILPITGLVAIIGLVMGLIGCVIAFKARVPTHLVTLVVSMGVCSAFLIFLALQFIQITKFPLINDITTDVENPPVYVAALARRGEKSNAITNMLHIREIQQRAYPDIKTLEVDASFEEAFNNALNVAKTMDWAVINLDIEKGIIEAVATTFLYGFKDDVVVRILPNPETDGSYIDLRSVSRVGASDLGTNANRIRKFFEEFSKLDKVRN